MRILLPNFGPFLANIKNSKHPLVEKIYDQFLKGKAACNALLRRSAFTVNFYE